MGTKKIRSLEVKKNKKASAEPSVPSADLIAKTLKRKKRPTKSEINEVKYDKFSAIQEYRTQEKVDNFTASSNESAKIARRKKKSSASCETKCNKSTDADKGDELSSMEKRAKTQVGNGEFSVTEVKKVGRKKKKSTAKNKTVEDNYPKEDHNTSFHSGVEEAAKEVNSELVSEVRDVDTDCSKGMKKWLNQYWSRRPGLKILQDNIDQFLVAHEATEEKARKEREAAAVEEGWTVVVHHKGRKKMTDAETGVTVGSVAQSAVMENLANKRRKELPLDFYRFQKREAKRNEVMQLQSKFEQEKKRIQQLRAARKFRPY